MDALGHADAGLLLEEAGEISTVIAVFCSDLRGCERRVAVGADVFLHRDDHGGQRERSALPAIQKSGGQVEKQQGGSLRQRLFRNRRTLAVPLHQIPEKQGKIRASLAVFRERTWQWSVRRWCRNPTGLTRLPQE